MPKRKYHGHTRVGKHHPLYNTWVAMRQRCSDPNHAAFKNYGGRGISVCKRWDDFTRFLADVGKRPPGRTLDRVDNDGNYKPSNVQWATPQEQAVTRRNSMPKNHPIARWRLRQEPPVTQDELGRMLGVGRSYICRLENGERRVALTMLDRVNRVTGLSPAVLRPDLARAMGHR